MELNCLNILIIFEFLSPYLLCTHLNKYNLKIIVIITIINRNCSFKKVEFFIEEILFLLFSFFIRNIISILLQ